MMHTPQTRARDTVEMIMARVQHNLEQQHDSRLSRSQYNAVYEAVMETLTKEVGHE